MALIRAVTGTLGVIGGTIGVIARAVSVIAPDAGAIVCAVVLAGCTSQPGSHNVITPVDQHRLAVMRADPVFRTAVRGTSFYDVGAQQRRGQVIARIYMQRSRGATLSPLPVQAFMRSVITGMQARGWVFYYSHCSFQSLEPDMPPGVLVGPISWFGTVYGYEPLPGPSRRDAGRLGMRRRRRAAHGPGHPGQADHGEPAERHRRPGATRTP